MDQTIALPAQDSKKGCDNPDDLSVLASTSSTSSPATSPGAASICTSGSDCGSDRSDRLSRVIAQLKALKVAATPSKVSNSGNGEAIQNTMVVSDHGHEATPAKSTKSPAQRLRDFLGARKQAKLESSKHAAHDAPGLVSSCDKDCTPDVEKKVDNATSNPYILPDFVLCLI